MIDADNLRRIMRRIARLAGEGKIKRAASGIETEGHDPKGHGAQHESPTAESGDAHE